MSLYIIGDAKGKRMQEDRKFMAYMMAAEKIMNVIFTIDQAVAFMHEYSLKGFANGVKRSNTNEKYF